MKIITPDWKAPKNIRAFTTTRHSYDAGSLTDKKNQVFKQLFQLPAEPIWLHQTHSDIAIEAKPEHSNLEADASFSKKPQHICVVSTADCLPILICNQEGSEVAAIHAGWRGLAKNIIAKTFAQLSSGKEWLVWLGPAIGPTKFEVGRDVYEAFVKNAPEHEVAFTVKSADKWLANIYELARIQLKALAIEQIYGGEYCTYSQADLFYSYRRDRGHAGRMASLIWIE